MSGFLVEHLQSQQRSLGFVISFSTVNDTLWFGSVAFATTVLLLYSASSRKWIKSRIARCLRQIELENWDRLALLLFTKAMMKEREKESAGRERVGSRVADKICWETVFILIQVSTFSSPESNFPYYFH
jgi:hypothetical protein